MFILYTILFSSRLPATSTALCHESLLIAASFVPDLNNLFVEVCVQCNTSCAGSRFRGHRAVPSDLHGFGASLGKGSSGSFVFPLGRKKGFIPEEAMSVRGLSTDPHRSLRATARNGTSSLRTPATARIATSLTFSQNRRISWVGSDPQGYLSPSPALHRTIPKSHTMCVTALSEHLLNSVRLGAVTASLGVCCSAQPSSG